MMYWHRLVYFFVVPVFFSGLFIRAKIKIAHLHRCVAKSYLLRGEDTNDCVSADFVDLISLWRAPSEAAQSHLPYPDAQAPAFHS